MKSPVFYLLLMVFGLLIFGCSKEIKPYEYYNDNDNGSNGTTELLNCVRVNGTLLQARLQTDPSSLSYVLIKFTHHPSQFNDDNSSLRFFSGIDTNSISSTSSGYVMFDSGSGVLLGSSPTGSDVDRAYLDNFSESLELVDVTFQVNVGPNARVLRITLDQGSALLEQAIALIPAIDANPNSYATNHPQSLVNLHPLLPYSNSGWTNFQFRQQGEHICTL